jgi:hypothetical protein
MCVEMETPARREAGLVRHRLTTVQDEGDKVRMACIIARLSVCALQQAACDAKSGYGMQ